MRPSECVPDCVPHARLPGIAAALLLTLTLTLAACGGDPPKPPEPPLRRQALEVEMDGAKRFARGDYAGAMRRFAEAERLHQSVDDTTAILRNRLHQAQAELALGEPKLALARIDGITETGDTGQDVNLHLLRAQAQLALGNQPAAQGSLGQAASKCGSTCPQVSSLDLLQARSDLAAGRQQVARQSAERALKRLRDGVKDNKPDPADQREMANAWRLIATSQLEEKLDLSTAHQAAEQALALDRQLALPEKIARDWLLIGRIRQTAGRPDASAAFQRALDVAQAAKLEDLARQASDAMTAATGAGVRP